MTVGIYSNKYDVILSLAQFAKAVAVVFGWLEGGRCDKGEGEGGRGEGGLWACVAGLSRMAVGRVGHRNYNVEG